MRTCVCLSLFGAQDIDGGDPGSLVRFARAADKAGIDQVNVTDHVVMGERTDRYPYGRFPVPVGYPWYEPLSVLSAVAGATTRIRLATGVLIAPLRPAALLAKQVATLDALSGGRVDLGVGAGWQPEEYAACGVPFEQRWSRLDDTIRAMRLLWDGEPVTFAAPSVRLDKVTSAPSPAQERVPVWYGVAATARQARRIAELGDGWIPISREPDEVGSGIATIREAFAEAGREPDELTVRAKPATSRRPKGPERWQATLEAGDALVEAGVHVVDVALAEHVDTVDQVDRFLETLVTWRDR